MTSTAAPGYNGSPTGSAATCQSIDNATGSIDSPEAKGSLTPRSEVACYPAIESQSRLISESKNRNRKIVRFMTVIAYIFFVSLAAIVLSLYYYFIWVPKMQLGPFPDPSGGVGPNGQGIYSLSSGANPGDSFRAGRKRGQVHHLVSGQQEAQLSSPQLYHEEIQYPRQWQKTSLATQTTPASVLELPTRSSVYSLISKKRLQSVHTRMVSSTTQPVGAHYSQKPP